MVGVIVASKIPREVGTVLKDLTVVISDGERLLDEITQPFFVRREATFEEWLQGSTETLGPPPAGAVDRMRRQHRYFYEVTSD